MVELLTAAAGVFPAYAGVSRQVRFGQEVDARLPRLRGGEP